MRYVEHEEQVAFFRLASYRRYGDSTVRDYCYAVPNGGTSGGRRAMLAALRRKAEGLTSGVPDIECMVANRGFTGLHIEMKRPNGVPSDVSEEQKKVMARMTKCGRKCVVAFGCKQAWSHLCEYLEIKE